MYNAENNIDQIFTFIIEEMKKLRGNGKSIQDHLLDTLSHGNFWASVRKDAYGILGTWTLHGAAHKTHIALFSTLLAPPL